MPRALREPLSPEQHHLLQAIFEPFDQTGSWPIWQYVDLTLDGRFGLDARDVLASLPVARDPNPARWSSRYELTWRMDSHMEPQPDSRIALTVAGLRYMPQAESLLGAFLTAVQYLVERQRDLVPSPDTVVEATVTSEEIAKQILTASIAGTSAPPVDATMLKVRQVLGHEPFLWSAISQPDPAKPDWTLQVPAVLRGYRDVTTIDDYLDRLLELVAPAGTEAPVAWSPGALDIPNAVGYLDAVWKNRTGSRLFVNLDPASIARLTQGCSSEDEFNSLMTALADVLGRVVRPGQAAPPQQTALETVRDYLASALDGDAADRVTGALDRLIRLRRIRVSAQHSDARHRAVTAFQEIGLPFPPHSWEHAWAHIAVQARSALDVIREEIHASLAQP
jgi:hypothetical protein